jgi:hypothetical protein
MMNQNCVTQPQRCAALKYSAWRRSLVSRMIHDTALIYERSKAFQHVSFPSYSLTGGSLFEASEATSNYLSSTISLRYTALFSARVVEDALNKSRCF